MLWTHLVVWSLSRPGTPRVWVPWDCTSGLWPTAPVSESITGQPCSCCSWAGRGSSCLHPPPYHLSTQSSYPGFPVSPNLVIRAPMQTLIEAQTLHSKGRAMGLARPQSSSLRVCHHTRAITTSSVIHGSKIPGAIKPNPAIFPLRLWFPFCFFFFLLFLSHVIFS